MKTLTLEQTKNQKGSLKIAKALTVFSTAIGLVFSGYLLSLAVEHKFSATDSVEPSEITASVRQKQLECLAKNIYYEAGSEPFEGKVAVAQVTINRAESEKYPNDICKVVYQKNNSSNICQFSWYCSVPNKAIKPIHSDAYKESMEVAKHVLLEGFRLPSLNESMFYHADYIANPPWTKSMTRVAKIGRHIFYKS